MGGGKMVEISDILPRTPSRPLTGQPGSDPCKRSFADVGIHYAFDFLLHVGWVVDLGLCTGVRLWGNAVLVPLCEEVRVALGRRGRTLLVAVDKRNRRYTTFGLSR